MRPSHHPSTEASTQMAMDYLEQSPAARVARESAEAHQRSDDTDEESDAAENESGRTD